MTMTEYVENVGRYELIDRARRLLDAAEELVASLERYCATAGILEADFPMLQSARRLVKQRREIYHGYFDGLGRET